MTSSPTSGPDFSSSLPDECLSLIFHSLSTSDRNRSSLVNRRWSTVEGQSRHRIAFNSTAQITPFIPSLFSRFDSVTKLALQCDRKSPSINDQTLTLISLNCVKLTRLKLRGCRDVTEFGMSTLAKNCKILKKFSCGSCVFGSKGLNAFLMNSPSLEELSVKRLRGEMIDIGVGFVSLKLKSVCLKELYNGQCFAPLLIGARNLRILRLINCLGEWDNVLRSVTKSVGLTEIRLEKVQVSDEGLEGIARCVNLETLHLMKVVECTDFGLGVIARSCGGIRKLHIDGWRTNRIGDEGLIAVARNGGSLVELVLIGINASVVGLGGISMGCGKLERLAICASDSIGDREMECLVSKLGSLKKICIKGCRLLTNDGIVAVASLCANLVKIKVKKCKRVTGDVVNFVKAKRPQLEVSLDVEAGEVRLLDGGEGPPTMADTNADAQAESSNNGSLWSGLRSRISLLGGNFVTSTVRRWSSAEENSNGDL